MIQKLNLRILTQFRDDLPARLSMRTKKLILDEVRTFLRWLHAGGDLEVVPPFPAVKVPRPEKKWMLDQDWRKVLQEILELHRPIFTFMRLYGVRDGEARALKWRDIGKVEGERTIKIRRTWSGYELMEGCKSGSDREFFLEDDCGIPASPKVVSLEGFIFTKPNGQPYSNSSLTKIWRKAVKAADVPYVSIKQATRVSFGFRKVAEGATYEEVGAVLGHRNVSTTQRYYAGVELEQMRKTIRGRTQTGTKS